MATSPHPRRGRWVVVRSVCSPPVDRPAGLPVGSPAGSLWPWRVLPPTPTTNPPHQPATPTIVTVSLDDFVRSTWQVLSYGQVRIVGEEMCVTGDSCADDGVTSRDRCTGMDSALPSGTPVHTTMKHLHVVTQHKKYPHSNEPSTTCHENKKTPTPT